MDRRLQGIAGDACPTGPRDTQEATLKSIRPGSARPEIAMAMPLFFVVVASLRLAACTEAYSAPPAPAHFDDRIAPLARERCDGCHARMPTGPMGVYRSARPFLTPGQPDRSPYYTVPTGRGHPAAWGDAASLVRAWIEAGAPE
jgi:hypothetical protein